MFGFENNFGKQNVSLSTWLTTITSLDIQSKRVTHRGIRRGVRKQRHQIQSSVLQSSDNHPHSPVRDYLFIGIGH